MAKHSRVILIQWLCLSVLLGFLSSAISSDAKQAAKAPNSFPTAAQNLQPQNKTVEEPPPRVNAIPPVDVKSGEAISVANSVANVAKLAVEMNNETVKRIETFYSTTVQIILGIVTVFGVLAGLLGSIAIGRIVKSTAKTQTQEILKPYQAEYSKFLGESTAIKGDHETLRREYNAFFETLQTERKEYEALRRAFTEFQEYALGNVRGLLASTMAWFLVTTYMQNIAGSKSEDDKCKFEALREEGRRLINDVVNQIKPQDKLVSSFALRTLGNILYYDNNFAAAVAALRESVTKDNENVPAHFNLACCACKLADKIEKDGAEKTDIMDLENEALSSLHQVLKLAPSRKAEALSEGETGDMRRIRNHPQFRLLIYD